MLFRSSINAIINKKAAQELRKFTMAYSVFYRTGRGLNDVKHYAERYSIYSDLLFESGLTDIRATETLDLLKKLLSKQIDDEVQQMTFEIDETSV